MRPSPAPVIGADQARLPGCKLLSPLLAILAQQYPSTKFVSIVSDHCIENYPDKNCPTLLIYRAGIMTGQIVGLGGMGGDKATVEGEQSLPCLSQRR